MQVSVASYSYTYSLQVYTTTDEIVNNEMIGAVC